MIIVGDWALPEDEEESDTEDDERMQTHKSMEESQMSLNDELTGQYKIKSADPAQLKIQEYTDLFGKQLDQLCDNCRDVAHLLLFTFWFVFYFEIHMLVCTTFDQYDNLKSQVEISQISSHLVVKPLQLESALKFFEP